MLNNCIDSRQLSGKVRWNSFYPLSKESNRSKQCKNRDVIFQRFLEIRGSCEQKYSLIASFGNLIIKRAAVGADFGSLIMSDSLGGNLSHLSLPCGKGLLDSISEEVTVSLGADCVASTVKDDKGGQVHDSICL